MKIMKIDKIACNSTFPLLDIRTNRNKPTQHDTNICVLYPKCNIGFNKTNMNK